MKQSFFYYLIMIYLHLTFQSLRFLRFLFLCGLIFALFYLHSSAMALGLGDSLVDASGATPSSISATSATPSSSWSSFALNPDVVYWKNSQGRVFAVQWKSQVMPDLHMILSQHFPSFIEAQKSKKTLLSQEFSIHHTDFILVSRGHLRSYRGFAYQPSLVPLGFSLNLLSSSPSQDPVR